MLLIENFKKKYHEVLVLQIPYTVFRPGIYWIRGENGSGKSSLFRSLAGIIPCEGDIRFDDGITLHGNAAKFRQRVNISEAEPVFPSFLTGKDIFNFVASARNATQTQRQHLIRLFGVDSFYFKPCDTYSSGMLKRLSLSMSFLGSPQVVLLDEPLITLDGSARQALVSEIMSKQRDGGVLLLSSHEMLSPDILPLAGTLMIENKTIVAL